MLRSLKYYLFQFLIVSFMAAGLSSCGNMGAQPTQTLSPLQDAYAVRDSIVIAKKALNDARSLGKISKAAYDTSWATTEDADKIVTTQIKSAHNGMVVKSELDTAKAKVSEAKGVLQ